MKSRGDAPKKINPAPEAGSNNPDPPNPEPSSTSPKPPSRCQHQTQGFVPSTVPAHLRARTAELISDRNKFVRMLRIKHKQFKRFVPFEPNDAQLRLWDLLDKSNRVVVIKARQVGISTAVRAWQFHRAYASPDPETFAVLSFHDRSARTLRRMDRRWLKELPSILHRETEFDSAEETIFADTQAGFSSFTTGGRGGTRSFEFSGGHLSEFAFYADADETLAQSVSTVGEGPLVVESTVNVPGDAFHRIIEGAPDNGWTLFTYWWWQHEAYRDERLPEGFERSEEEEDLAGHYGLDDAQLFWRRRMVATLGLNKFKREYPGCLDDAFLSREAAYFMPSDLDNIATVWFDTPERELSAPIEDERYVIGVDTAAGVGLDYSALAVVHLATLQPVYIERNNRLSPNEWAARVATIGQRYNNALLLCESNNHGHVVIHELKRLHYHRVWKDARGKPWYTTVRSKLDAYETLREHIRAGIIFQLDQSTLHELRGLEVRKVTPEAPSGLHDDLAMALALAYRCVRSAPASHQRDGARNHIDQFISRRRTERVKNQALPWRTTT